MHVTALGAAKVGVTAAPIRLVGTPDPTAIDVGGAGVLVSLLPTALADRIPVAITAPMQAGPSPVVGGTTVEAALKSRGPRGASKAIDIPLGTGTAVAGGTATSVHALPITGGAVTATDGREARVGSPFAACPYWLEKVA